MAIMIPSVISPEVKSAAERKIFDWFKNAPGTDDWIVLHSLGITNHKQVIYGETDFFVLAPGMGIFALEVKGGRVRRENGVWYFTDKYDKTNSKARGPFDQAKDGIFNLVAALKEKIDQPHKHLQNTFFGYGVMFPDITYTAAGPDEEQWQVFDVRDGNRVKEYISRIFAGAKDRWEAVYTDLNKDKIPDTEDVRYLASLLRGDFDYVPSINMQLQTADKALIRLTREQYRCLDQLDDNPRCLIRGAAGTGKTLLAIEEARKSVARGEKVALFCFNSNLADWLKQCFQEDEMLRPVFVGTLHKYIAQILRDAGVEIPYPRDPQKVQLYYQQTLPQAVVKILREGSAHFDKIIIDEAQDLITRDFLMVLDASLSRGLSRGRWTMFGDFSMQAIYSDGLSGEDMLELLEEYSWFIRFKLNVNCRNTKPICREIQTITGFDSPGSSWMNVDGPPVQYITWSSMDEQCDKLKDLLQKLREDHVDPEKITILSPRKKADSVVSLLNDHAIRDFRIPVGMHTTFATIQSYKGLENSVIILTDIESFSAEKLMYVGLSRASSGLYILESEAAKREYDDLFIRRLLQ